MLCSSAMTLESRVSVETKVFSNFTNSIVFYSMFARNIGEVS